MSDYQLAQVNVGVVRGEMGSSVMQGFVARLDEINWQVVPAARLIALALHWQSSE